MREADERLRPRPLDFPPEITASAAAPEKIGGVKSPTSGETPLLGGSAKLSLDGTQ